MSPIGGRVEDVAGDDLVVVDEHRDHRPVADELSAEAVDLVDGVGDARKHFPRRIDVRRRPRDVLDHVGEPFAGHVRRRLLPFRAPPHQPGQQDAIDQQQHGDGDGEPSGNRLPLLEVAGRRRELVVSRGQRLLGLGEHRLGSVLALLDGLLEALDVELGAHEVVAGAGNLVPRLAPPDVAEKDGDEKRDVDRTQETAHVKPVQPNEPPEKPQKIGDGKGHGLCFGFRRLPPNLVHGEQRKQDQPRPVQPVGEGERQARHSVNPSLFRGNRPPHRGRRLRRPLASFSGPARSVCNYRLSLCPLIMSGVT